MTIEKSHKTFGFTYAFLRIEFADSEVCSFFLFESFSQAVVKYTKFSLPHTYSQVHLTQLSFVIFWIHQYDAYIEIFTDRVYN